MNADLETTKLTRIHMFMFLINRNISVVETDKKVFYFYFKQYTEKNTCQIVYASTAAVGRRY